MSKLDEAMKSYEAFKEGEKLLADLKTAAVYETPFYLRYPISETETVAEDGDVIGKYPGKTIEEAEKWLNEEDDQCDSMAFGFMDNIMDEDSDYPDELREAVGNGLIKKFIYRFDDDRSGKLYVEAARRLTEKEQDTVQDWLRELHFQGWGDMSDCFNVFLDHSRCIDVWNTWNDADRVTEFRLSEIPPEGYLSGTGSGKGSPAMAAEDIPA